MSGTHNIAALCIAIAGSAGVFAQSPIFGRFQEQVDGVGEARSLVIAPDGEILLQSQHSNEPLSEFDVDESGRHAVVSTGGRVELSNHDGTSIGSIERPPGVLALDFEDSRLAILDSRGHVLVYTVVSEDASEVSQKVNVLPAFEASGYFGAQGVTLDSNGGVWIADTFRHRLVHLGPDGKEILAFGARGAFPGLFNAPSATDLHDGHVFVADTLNHRIAVHDAETGEFQYQWGMHAVYPREGEGKVHYPEDVAVSPDGSYVAVLEPFERRYQRFVAMPEGEDPSGKLPQKLAVESHFGAQLGVHNDLLVLHEPESCAAMVFDLRMNIPIHVTTFGRPGSGGSQFGSISSLAVDADKQEIWFLDQGNRRIAAWRLNRDRDVRLRQDPFMATFARSITFDALAADVAEDFRPQQLLFHDGQIHLLGDHGQRIVTLDENLQVQHVATLSEAGGDGLSWIAPNSPEGWVGLSQRGDRVSLFDRDGQVQSDFSLDPSAHPVALAALQNGGVVVSERAADRLRVYDSTGSNQDIGESGSWDGALWLPGEVFPFPGGRVVVVDQGNHRAQVFDPETGEWSMSFSLGMGHDTPRFLKKDFVTDTQQEGSP